MKENIHQNRLKAKVVFQITPKSSGLLAFANGDIQLDLPDKSGSYQKLVQAVAKFANEFVIQNFPGSLSYFKSSGMLTASSGTSHFIYYCVYADDQAIENKVLIEVEKACRQFLGEIYDVNQNDFFSVDMPKTNTPWPEEIQNIAEDFKKRNKNFDLNNPVAITSDLNPTPVNIVAQIKATTISSDLESQPYQINALAEGYKITPKKIFVNEVLFDSTVSKEIGLIADNIEVFKKAKELISNNQFLTVRIVEKLAKDSLKKVKYFDEIEVWEGPKGLLC